MDSKIILASALALLGVTIGCSGKPRGAVEVPNVPPVETSINENAPAQTNATVAVRSLRDGRAIPNPPADTSASDRVQPEGNVGSAVETAIRESLTDKGLIVTRDAPVIVSGEILKWGSEIKPGMPKTVESKAEIYVEVRDVSGKKLYDGTFSGAQELKEGMVSKKDVQKSLSLAMQEAVTRVVADREFLDCIWESSQSKYPGRIARVPTTIR